MRVYQIGIKCKCMNITHPTAAGLHETVLLMKHTPNDIDRVTNALLLADDQTLNKLPRQTYQHYFDEIGIVILNWMGRGENESIQKTLESLTHGVFSYAGMKQLPELTIKQRIGLQLRVICAQMTLYLKVKNSIRYNAMLLGSRYEVSRAVLHVLYEKANVSDGFGFKVEMLDYKTILEEVNALLPGGRKTTIQNINHLLTKLVKNGLVVKEHPGVGIRFRLSERGITEARYHVKADGEPATSTANLQKLVTKQGEENKQGSVFPIDEFTQQFEQDAGAVLTLTVDERDYSMTKISRLVESSGTQIICSYFSRRKYGWTNQSQLILKLDRENITNVISSLERSGYAVGSVASTTLQGAESASPVQPAVTARQADTDWP